MNKECTPKGNICSYYLNKLQTPCQATATGQPHQLSTTYTNQPEIQCPRTHYSVTILPFADDTTLFMSHNDISVLYRDANKHINGLYYWFCANKLALNASNTKYIILRSKYKKTSLEKLTLSINGTQLIRIGDDCEETSAKFLGIYIDEHLTWQKHINHVNRKISRAMFAIKQTKHFLPRHILRNLYFTLIHSHLTYGIIAWGNAGQSIIHKTITLQKRAIRIINSAGYNSHTDPLFSKSNILKFADLYEYQCALFMFDYTGLCT